MPMGSQLGSFGSAHPVLIAPSPGPGGGLWFSGDAATGGGGGASSSGSSGSHQFNNPHHYNYSADEGGFLHPGGGGSHSSHSGGPGGVIGVGGVSRGAGRPLGKGSRHRGERGLNGGEERGYLPAPGPERQAFVALASMVQKMLDQEANRGLSQRKAALRMGVAPPDLSRWRRSKCSRTQHERIQSTIQRWLDAGKPDHTKDRVPTAAAAAKSAERAASGTKHPSGMGPTTM
jgi:hypothetical protein